MNFKSLLLASSLSITSLGVANAADIVVHDRVPVVVVPQFSWTGIYLGAQAGYGWNTNKTDYTYTYMKKAEKEPAADAPVYHLNDSAKTNGFLGGLYAGYNADFIDSAVLGIETDFAWGNSKYEFKGVKAFNNTDATVDTVTFEGHRKLNWMGATRLRVGYSADRFMPYVAAGVSYAGLNTAMKVSDTTNNTFDAANAAAPTEFEAKDQSLLGWTAGVGVDYAALDNVVVRLEYRYNDFGKKNRDLINATQKTTLNGNDVRVGVAYKF